MKRAIILAMVALLAMLILVPMAMSQQVDDPESNGMATVAEKTIVNGTTMIIYSNGTVEVPLSGGPSILLPTAALVLGSGILTYAFLRRR